MRYLFTPLGTEGDVRPIVAVAKGLRDAGHGVAVATSVSFKPLVERAGLRFLDIGIDTRSFMSSNPQVAAGHMLATLKSLIGVAAVFLDRQVRFLLQSGSGFDVIIGSGILFGGTVAAEKLGLPYRHVVHVPQVIPSRAHPPLTIANQRLPGAVNAMLWKLSVGLLTLVFRPIMNQQRLHAGLVPLRSIREFFTRNMVIAMDPALAAVPPDVDADYRTTAYWPLDEAATESPELNRFLDSGDPPVYIGFGSMTDADASATIDMITRAQRALGVRLLVAGGWAELEGRGNADVFFASHLPHHLVLPRVAAAVHHGGAGTTWSVARAGVPQAAIPHLLDQHYWAERICRLQVGPRGFVKNKLTSRRLAAIIADLAGNHLYRVRARELANAIASRNGVEEGVRLLGSIGGG